MTMQSSAASTKAAKVQSMTWKQKVDMMVVLIAKSPKHEEEIRSRIEAGRGIEVYGGLFDTAVLKAALEKKRILNIHTNADSGKKRTLPTEEEIAQGSTKAPRTKGISSPEKLSRAQQFAASKRYLDASRSSVGDGIPSPSTNRMESGLLKRLRPTSHTSVSPSTSKDFSEGASSTPSRPPPSSDTKLKHQSDSAERISKESTPCRSAKGSPHGSEGSSSPGAPDTKLPSLRQEKAAHDSHRGSDAKGNSRVSEPEPEPCDGEVQKAELSVKDMKVQLSSYGIDSSGCVEKSDLLDLWKQFDDLRQKPIQELRSKWVALGNSASQIPSTAEAIAASLLKVTIKKTVDVPAAQPTAAPARSATEQFRRQDSDNVVEREQEAAKEVKRIAALRKERYGNLSMWAFAVLGLSAGCDNAAVQKAYRGLMRKLHPDKVEQSEAVSKVLDTLKQAKDMCERSVSRQSAPGPLRKLTYSTLCAVPGRRRYKLHWEAPEHREAAPVRRYIVAAFDPAYGKALTIATPEPDYSEELRRFVTVEELRDFTLSEEELQKMPALWKKSTATLQVAAANEAGQSAWVNVTIRLDQQSFGAGDTSEADAFAKEFRKRVASKWTMEAGSDLRAWLSRQKKAVLVEFMQSIGLNANGSKEALVDELSLAYRQNKLPRIK